MEVSQISLMLLFFKALARNLQVQKNKEKEEAWFSLAYSGEVKKHNDHLNYHWYQIQVKRQPDVIAETFFIQ